MVKMCCIFTMMIFITKFLLGALLLFTCTIVKAQPPTVGLLKHSAEAFAGYTLFSGSTNTYLIDNCGQMVHQWQSSYRPAATFYLLENGDLIRPVKTNEPTNFRGGGIGGGIEWLDWNGNLIWFFDYAETNSHHQHHDIEILPNGNILILAWEYKTSEEAIAAGRSPKTIAAELWPTQIVEVKPILPDSAAIVWQWHLWDHLIQDADNTKINYGKVAAYPEKLDINFKDDLSTRADWIHANALLHVKQFDWIVFSSKHNHEIYVIDHSTTTGEAAGSAGGKYNKGGDFLYRWGNPRAYRKGTPADKKLFDQHDVTFIEATANEPAQFLVFNNGTSRGNEGGFYSTVVSIELPIDEMGNFILSENEAHLPNHYYFEYEDAEDRTKLYSANGSSAQRLANGNTLIAEGNTGYFVEINALKEPVWIYQNPVTAGFIFEQGVDLTLAEGAALSPRARRYALDYPAFYNKDVSPKGKIELNAYEDDCEIKTSISTVFYKDAKVTYDPISKLLIVESNLIHNLQLFDLNGRFAKASYQKNTLQINGLNKGIYFLIIEKEGKHFTKKMMLD